MIVSLRFIIEDVWGHGDSAPPAPSLWPSSSTPPSLELCSRYLLDVVGWASGPVWILCRKESVSQSSSGVEGQFLWY
jgi:hypothetical protein